MKLTKEQLKQYNENGFLLIKGLIPLKTLDKCSKHFVGIAEGNVDKGNILVMKEVSLIGTGVTGQKLINKLQDIVFDDVFSLYTENKELLDVVSQIIGPNITAVHSMLINKPPGTSRHPPHQDLHYFPFRPADKITASWTAMEHVDKQNGCLYVIPGSHKPGILYPHDYPVTDGKRNKAYHGIVNEAKVAPESSRKYVEMEAGDTLFFHPLLVHGSGLNLTERFRKAISCHYASSECHYIDVEGTTQENIAREVESMARKRGAELTFKEIWQYRSKIVRGPKCNL